MNHKLIIVLLAMVLAHDMCFAQASRPAAAPGATTAPAGCGAGRGGFGGAIQLGPDDKPALLAPPAGFNIKRDNIALSTLKDVPYESRSLGTRGNRYVYTPAGYSADSKYPVLYPLHDLY